jgi:hypothetical protein
MSKDWWSVSHTYNSFVFGFEMSDGPLLRSPTNSCDQENNYDFLAHRKLVSQFNNPLISAFIEAPLWEIEACITY